MMTTDQRVNDLMDSGTVRTLLAENRMAEERIRNAIKFLFEDNEEPRDGDILWTLERIRVPLLTGRITAFCSYKEKDRPIARDLEALFSKWSKDLRVNHMETFGIGKQWRAQIKKDIPSADWFLLLMPGAEAERDWPLFEAGYFRPGGRTLSRRFVCLHHPDNEVTDALGDTQSVPAEPDRVRRFLEQLLIEPNWIPGLPPVAPGLEGDLPEMAQKIIDLIKPPLQRRRCCGPHMRVDFGEIEHLHGWELLASGFVKEPNEECRELFDIAWDPKFTPRSLKEWLRDVDGVGRDEGWVVALADAIRAVGVEKRPVRALDTVMALPEGRFVQPMICAVTRRKTGSLETIDLLFLDAPSPQDHGLMSPRFAALAKTLEFAVELRSNLERAASRRPSRESLMDFANALRTIEYRAASDPQLGADPEAAKRLTLELFDSSDRTEIERMYEGWGEMRRSDGTGTLDRALAELDIGAFQGLLGELRRINQRFLEMVSTRFSAAVQSPEQAWVGPPEPGPPLPARPAPTVSPGRAAPASIDPRSIAVLPFENLSADRNDVFADGMTEEIVSRLSCVKGLRVLSRYAVTDYKRTNKSRRQIADELEVAHLLEGSVRREGDRVRITAQLIDPSTRRHLWADSYERQLDDVFAVQRAVAEAITSALDIELTPQSRAALEAFPTEDLTAYRHYHVGLRHYLRYTRDHNEQAIARWRKALEEDPDYALAHAGLARGHYQRAARFGFSRSDELRASLAAAERAVELDPVLPEAHAALGSALGAIGLANQALEAELKAVELKPSDLVAVMNAGVTYAELGQLDESLRWKRRALALDPLSSNTHSQLGLTYMLLEMDAEAEENLRRAIELDPDTVQARAFLARLHRARGEDERALAQAEAILTRYPSEPMGLNEAGLAHWFAGRSSEAAVYFRQNIEQARIALAQIVWSLGHRDEAEELLAPAVALLEESLARGSDTSWVYRKLAAAHAVRGERERAYERLERAVATGGVDHRTLDRLPIYAGMRAEERFRRCIESMRHQVAEMRVRVEAQQAA